MPHAKSLTTPVSLSLNIVFPKHSRQLLVLIMLVNKVNIMVSKTSSRQAPAQNLKVSTLISQGLLVMIHILNRLAILDYAPI